MNERKLKVNSSDDTEKQAAFPCIFRSAIALFIDGNHMKFEHFQLEHSKIEFSSLKQKITLDD